MELGKHIENSFIDDIKNSIFGDSTVTKSVEKSS